jgi:hypothetical protein
VPQSTRNDARRPSGDPAPGSGLYNAEVVGLAHEEPQAGLDLQRLIGSEDRLYEGQVFLLY